MRAMSTGRRRRVTPREQYPDFPATDHVDEITAKAVAVARNLDRLITTYIERGYVTSVRDFAGKIGVHHTILGRVIAGERWIDSEVLARLEVGTGQPLWETQVPIDMDSPPPFLTDGS